MTTACRYVAILATMLLASVWSSVSAGEAPLTPPGLLDHSGEGCCHGLVRPMIPCPASPSCPSLISRPPRTSLTTSYRGHPVALSGPSRPSVNVSLVFPLVWNIGADAAELRVSR